MCVTAANYNVKKHNYLLILPLTQEYSTFTAAISLLVGKI